jgi:hypothetical protein
MRRRRRCAASRIRSLAPPTNPIAVARMKSGNNHHREALKRAAVVATRDQAAAEFQAAMDEYVAAAMASPSPSVLYNLAQTYRAAGDYPRRSSSTGCSSIAASPGSRFRNLVECQIAAMAAELDARGVDRAAARARRRGGRADPEPTAPAPAPTSAPAVALEPPPRPR